MLSGEAINTKFIVFGLTWSGLELTIYCTRSEHANHYTTDAIQPFNSSKVKYNVSTIFTQIVRVISFFLNFMVFTISQLIRYTRVSSNYSDFLKRHLYLRNRLLDQGYTKIRLIRSLKKFIFRYQDLVEIYNLQRQ